MRDSTERTDENLSSITDDEEELLSSTDFGGSLRSDEKQWRSQDLETGRRSTGNRFTRAFWSYRGLIDTILLLVIIGLLAALQKQLKMPPKAAWQVGGDYTGGSVQIPTKVVKWEADMDYAPRNMTHFFTDETLAKWNALLPANAGYPTTETFFTTSMTHQLHCLYMMGKVYSGVMTNITHSLPHDYNTHFLHCIDYLRQAVMCAGDLALEAHDPKDSDDLGPQDGGWSGQHVCKDYSQVKTYLEGQIKDGVRSVLPIDD
ncbi:hypothetical protein BP6252_08778 [Coleophoma cylindrospora]|uniref:Oxidase ustYa n=1 Tax=Coleophoma cylindrospora TaxID=1849047 RepID=A0A3D8R750_9HELO|nr:hypothetical protein BP6252_08778 [Coleophoma cylindrospora]